MARKSVATEELFQGSIARLFGAVGHADRREPLRAYVVDQRGLERSAAYRLHLPEIEASDTTA